MRIDIKRTKIYNELSHEMAKMFFKTTNHKVVPNIDNIYYTVFLKGDTNENVNVLNLLNEIKLKKELALERYEDINFQDDLFVKIKRYDTYSLCLSCEEKYDIFFTETIPNLHTPRIVVQIRSKPLWMGSYDDILFETHMVLEKILSKYQLQVKSTRENRIDYAYHTNLIQNPSSHFSDDNLSQTLVTDFYDMQKHYEIKKKRNIETDYIALGNRKSNNNFIRIYDKTKEVIQKSKKIYFLDIWYHTGIISYYDKFCLEHAYVQNNYNKRYEGALYFYLEHGKDDIKKEQIKELMSDYNKSIDDYEQYAKTLLPKITTVLNIEFETKRKYYYNYGTVIDELNCRYPKHALARIFKIIDNQSLFLKNLHGRTLYFEDRLTGEVKSWWKRIQSTKLFGFEYKEKLNRDYKKHMDKARIIQATVNKVASNAVYNGKDESDFIQDISDLLANVNDNDKVQYEIRQLEKNVTDKDSVYLRQYTSKKRLKALKNKHMINEKAQQILEVEIDRYKKKYNIRELTDEQLNDCMNQLCISFID